MCLSLPTACGKTGISRKGVNLVLILGALALPAAQARAQSLEDSGQPLTFSSTLNYVSQYMFRGAHNGDSSLEPSIEADLGNEGFGLWSNIPLGGGLGNRQVRELDAYAFVKKQVNQKIALNVGAQLYTYPKSSTFTGYFRSTFEPYLEVDTAVAGVTITPKIFYDLILRQWTGEFNAARTVPLPGLHTELDFLGTVGGYSSHHWDNTAQDGVPGATTKGYYWLGGVTAPFELRHSWKCSVGIAYTAGFGTVVHYDGYYPDMSNPIAIGRWVVSASLSYSF